MRGETSSVWNNSFFSIILMYLESSSYERVNIILIILPKYAFFICNFFICTLAYF